MEKNKNTEAEKNFLKRVKKAAQSFKELSSDNILLFHHNDADGLTSGTILLKAFERLGKKVRAYALEKPYPKVLKEILSDPFVSKDTLVVFADFASGILDEIVKLTSKNVLVLDHHLIADEVPLHIELLNPLLDGVHGGSECSASTVCYLFARELADYNKDLSHLALIGALGDGHIDSEGAVFSLNAKVLEDADDVQFSEGENKRDAALKAVADAVDALGSYGYFMGGPDIAIKGLAEGFDERYFGYAKKFSDEFEEFYAKFKTSLELKTSKHIQYFVLGEDSKKFGVKTVGLLCSRIAKEGLVDEEKYIAGFQPIPDKIPGFGPFTFNEYKVSMRLPKTLHQKVIAKKAKPLTEILPSAARKLGGFVDACHPHAAAVVVGVGEEGELVKGLEEALI